MEPLEPAKMPSLRGASSQMSFRRQTWPAGEMEKEKNTYGVGNERVRDYKGLDAKISNGQSRENSCQTTTVDVSMVKVHACQSTLVRRN